MIGQASPPAYSPRKSLSMVAVSFVIVTVFACAIYANLSFAVSNRANFKYFPPFKAYVNANQNDHVGAEYFCIAQSLIAGEGFSNPFHEKTGRTAWMPPVLPLILTALLWLGEGDRDFVMAGMIFLQVYTLILTGVVVLAVTCQVARRLWAGIAAVLFVGVLLCDFHLWFQFTHDCWLVLLAMDVVLAGFCLMRPLQGWTSSAVWGVAGGLCALINPMVALGWGMASLIDAFRERAWKRFGMAVLLALLTLMPWIVRNYYVFGRWIPVKSNLAYELYQSQCLQPDGLLQGSTFGSHPYASAGIQRQQYKALGEMEFLDRKRAEFWKAVWNDPEDFLDRVASRFLGATVWYVPFSRNETRTTVLWINRLTHPLPFLAMWLLVFTAFWKPLHWSQWGVIALYILYLMPYVAVSYYERYAMPLLGVKVLLLVFALDRLLSFFPRRAVVVEEVEEAEIPSASRKKLAHSTAFPQKKSN